MKGSAAVQRDEAMMHEEARANRTGLRLAVGSALCLAFAGGLLWWREGADVFASLVTTAFAWCF